MTGRIVLAYADEDRDEVRSLYERLRRAGFDPWLDDVDILPGRDRDAAIRNAIRNAAAVIACLSSKTIAKAGSLHRQLRQALSTLAEKPPGDIFLIPLRLDDCDLPAHDFRELGLNLPDLQQADLFEADGFERLSRALTSTLDARGACTAPSSQDDRRALVLASFEALHAASVRAAAGTNHPAATAIRESLGDCLDDLKSGTADLETLATFPDYLAGLAKDIDEHLLGRHFEAMPAIEVLKKLEALTETTGKPGQCRIDSLDHRDLVDELRRSINAALDDLPASGLDRSTSAHAERELRHLRREVGKPRHDAKIVDERRKRLERLRVNLLERTTLLTEALLAEGFPNLPTGTVFRHVPEIWCPQLVMIPAGSFLMGSPEDEEERWDVEGPQYEVTITKAFALGRYAVTFDEYDHFCETTDRETTDREKPGDEGWGRERRPVINVSYDDALAYCAWLSEVTGASLRLPTEAMWEYACRAGTTTPFSFGADITTDQVNYNGNHPYAGGAKGKYREQTVPVGSLASNPWGFHEMHGNVWEWCADWHGDYASKAAADPQGPATGTNRVVRGGSWGNGDARSARSASRLRYVPGVSPTDSLGFRCAGVQEVS